MFDLAAFLGSVERPRGTLSYQELLGFLFAIASSPESVPRRDWMPIVFADRDPACASEQESVHLERELLALRRRCGAQIARGTARLPFEIHVGAAAHRNLEGDAPLRLWSRGFYLGHEYLEKLWDAHTPPAYRGDVERCVMVLTYFADPEIAAATHRHFVKKGGELAESAAVVAGELPEAMRGYASMGRQIMLGLMKFGRKKAEPAHSDKPGRNAPCPCGSGRKYKHCCLPKQT
jgi:uncharacterized protein